MDAHQCRSAVGDFALDECDVLQSVADLTEGDDAEVTVLRRQLRLHTLLDEALTIHPILDQVGYGDDLEPMLLRKDEELGQTGHGAVLIDNLDEAAHGTKSGETAEVDRRLGMSGADEDPLVAGSERIDVTRSGEVIGTE